MRTNKCYFCGSPHYAGGLCRNCYDRMRRNGTPEYKKTLKTNTVRGSFGDRRAFYTATLEPRNERERQILDMIAQGMTYKQIAEVVGVSIQRVGALIANMKKKGE